MGIRLAQSAMSPTWASRLSERAQLVLIHMAMTALDKPGRDREERTYFGGHAALAIRLTGSEEATDADMLKVRRAVKELRAAGAISVARPAMNGRPAAYRLNLTPGQDTLV